jgi:DNA-binding transcriptional ArsR family regulator
LQRAEPFAAQGIQKAFDTTAKGGKKVSLADLIVLAGCAAIVILHGRDRLIRSPQASPSTRVSLTLCGTTNNLSVMSSSALRIPDDELSRTLAALADPTRRSILEQLSLGPRSVRELGEPYDMSQPAVSKHLKVLEAAGLVSQEPGNRHSPRRLELGPFVKAAEWMDAYARIWGARHKHFTRGAAKAVRSKASKRAGGRPSQRSHSCS